MTRPITINYLPYRRPQYRALTFDLLKRIPTDLCEQVHITMFIEDLDDSPWKTLATELEGRGFTVDLPYTEHKAGNYMGKIRQAVEHPSPYSVKLDEDCFLGPDAWEYFLRQIPVVLEDDQNLLLAPMLSNGIPTTEYFVEDFFPPEVKDEIFEVYRHEGSPCSAWGVSYITIQEAIKGMKQWDPEVFYRAMSQIKHFYKGVHPVRLKAAAQFYLNYRILEHIEQFVKPHNYELMPIRRERPYFCNSFFAIKTEKWKTIVGSPELSRDNYDEVPLNLYRDKHNLNMVFIRRAFGVHTMYGAIGHYENDEAFYEKFAQAVRAEWQK